MISIEKAHVRWGQYMQKNGANTITAAPSIHIRSTPSVSNVRMGCWVSKEASRLSMNRMNISRPGSPVGRRRAQNPSSAVATVIPSAVAAVIRRWSHLFQSAVATRILRCHRPAVSTISRRCRCPAFPLPELLPVLAYPMPTLLRCPSFTPIAPPPVPNLPHSRSPPACPT